MAALRSCCRCSGPVDPNSGMPAAPQAVAAAMRPETEWLCSACAGAHGDWQRLDRGWTLVADGLPWARWGDCFIRPPGSGPAAHG